MSTQSLIRGIAPDRLYNLAAWHDPTKSYNQYEFCIYKGTLYRANQAVSAGPFNPEQWTAVTVGELLTTLNASLGGLSFQAVDALPESPDANTIYIVKEST